MTTFFCYIRSVLLFFNKNMDIKTNKEQKGKKKRYRVSICYLRNHIFMPTGK